MELRTGLAALFGVAVGAAGVTLGLLAVNWTSTPVEDSLEPGPSLTGRSVAEDSDEAAHVESKPAVDGVASGAGQGETGSGSFTYTFDGEPGAPLKVYGLPDFDVQVHKRSMNEDLESIDPMDAHHGPNCEPPGHHGEVAHQVDSWDETVYQCANHIMTAINGEDYALIYLTPDRMLDWSDGEATLSIDVSTLDLSSRDWWDIWLQPWDNNMAVPFNNGDVDLQGEPADGEYFTIHNNLSQNKAFKFESHAEDSSKFWVEYENHDAMQRDTFVLTIRADTFDFCKPDEGICWFEDERHGLSISRAVVSFGHHSYTPFKDGGGGPNTWHWDNLALSDSVPFTIIRANERHLRNEGTITFDTPAPAGSYLRFSGLGRVWIDGEEVPEIPGEDPHSGHFGSFWHQIPEGTTQLRYQGEQDWRGGGDPAIKDISIFAMDES
jgi:hypothetical protein